MKKVFLVSFLSLFTAVVLHAADIVVDGSTLNPVHTAVPLLSIAPDARGGGMGDVGAATEADVNSQYWNPSKFAFAKSKAGLGFSYTPWLSKLNVDINLAYLAGYWKFSEGQAVSASLRYFSLGDVIFREGPPPAPEVLVRPNEFAIDVAYSRLLSENWSAAVALRYIRSDLTAGVSLPGSEQMYPGNSVAADVAAMYSKPVLLFGNEGNLGIGLNISNIGTKISYDEGNTSNFIPTNLRLGGSLSIPFDDFNKLAVNLDFNKFLVPTYPQGDNGEALTPDDPKVKEYNDMGPIAGIFRSFGDAPRGFKEEIEEIYWSAGLEYSYRDQFFVRGGYFHESQNKGNRKYFTAGAGFRLNIFQLDAAYVIATSQSNPLDQTLRFSLSFDLAGIKNLMGR
ncbi:MAG: type IX secretion system outer membrane channel protein PorV [Prevotellaceae bacterium]|jgi:hypothetical protein|nr:type IX secretion system outer membrane channel protein PorV [Prevotellaceae bacterium]